jgi:uncharacterized protein (DUF1697 family)
MSVLIGLLRAVNVGGTGKLPMAELKALCEKAGFSRVQTYIASGNVIFESSKAASKAKALLEKSLETYAKKPVGVVIRTPTEMVEVLSANPFSKQAPNCTVAIFLDKAPPPDTLDFVTGMKDEKISLGKREIYVFYGAGMGTSKLRIPAAAAGTARNMNTVAKLAELAASRTVEGK